MKKKPKQQWKPLVVHVPTHGVWNWRVTDPDCRALGIRWHTDIAWCGCAIAISAEAAQSYAQFLATAPQLREEL